MENKEQAILHYAERMIALFKNRRVRIIAYILAFLAIHISFGSLIYNARALTTEELTTETITVDEVNYSPSKKRGAQFWISAGNRNFGIHIGNLRQHNLTVTSFR